MLKVQQQQEVNNCWEKDSKGKSHKSAHGYLAN